MREKFKKQKGITLIALIITIIIMLILAIVSINIIVNQGIITKSKTAVDKYQIEAEKEAIKIGYSEYIADKYSGKTPLELKVSNAQVSEPTDEGWTITFNKTGNVYKLSADGKTIEGPIQEENEETLTDEEMQAALQSFTANPENYIHSEQSSTNKDRAIGTDGQAVNLDLWLKRITNEENSEIALSNYDGSEGNGPAYDKTQIVNGKIKGTIPQYIYIAEKDKVYTVTELVSTFVYCTNLVKSPAIPTSVKDMQSTFYQCTSLEQLPTIPSNVTNMSRTFQGCTSLMQAPAIPSSVTNIGETFRDCTNLTQAPAIPSSVTYMNGTFLRCTNLTGIVRINSRNTEYAHECFSDITNNITVQVPANSTTYNTFNEAYGSSSNIKIEAIENQQVLSMLPTEEEKKEIIDTEYDFSMVAINGELIGSEISGDAAVALTKVDGELNQIVIYTPTKRYFYLFKEDYLGSELGNVSPDDKWYCTTYSEGSTAIEYNGPCPISKDMFTEIYSESYLDRIIASFK